ncbi:hypothetical protein D3C85_1163330 [compost metagenome]
MRLKTQMQAIARQGIGGDAKALHDVLPALLDLSRACEVVLNFHKALSLLRVAQMAMNLLRRPGMQRVFKERTRIFHQRRHGLQVSEANDLASIDAVMQLASGARYGKRAVHDWKSPEGAPLTLDPRRLWRKWQVGRKSADQALGT